MKPATKRPAPYALAFGTTVLAALLILTALVFTPHSALSASTKALSSLCYCAAAPAVSYAFEDPMTCDTFSPEGCACTAAPASQYACQERIAGVLCTRVRKVDAVVPVVDSAHNFSGRCTQEYMPRTAYVPFALPR